MAPAAGLRRPSRARTRSANSCTGDPGLAQLSSPPTDTSLTGPLGRSDIVALLLLPRTSAAGRSTPTRVQEASDEVLRTHFTAGSPDCRLPEPGGAGQGTGGVQSGRSSEGQPAERGAGDHAVRKRLEQRAGQGEGRNRWVGRDR